jgi:hypothetical protein
MQIRGVRKASAPTRLRSVASFLGLVAASVVCLCAGALVAVIYEGLPRLIFAGAGFSGYLFFFAHALRELALPSVLVEGRPAPDGEVRGEPVHRKTLEETGRNRGLRAAA